MTKKALLSAAALAASMTTFAAPAAAQEGYIGNIMLVGYDFCPRGTTEANGQLLAISSHSALFSLYTTIYGGDGRTTFALPDLRGRTVVHLGQGPGLSDYRQGEVGGAEKATLLINNMPAHTHTAMLKASSGGPTTDDPTGASLADFPNGGTPIYNNTVNPNVPMNFNSIQVNSAGGNQPFQILSPFLTLRYCVVLEGIYPSRG